MWNSQVVSHRKNIRTSFRGFRVFSIPIKQMRVGLDFSGVDSPLFVLPSYIDHVFSCEVDKTATAVLLTNHSPTHFYPDITKRDHSKVPDVDLYVAGFPCTSWSTMGQRKGRGDPRGRLFDHVLAYLTAKRPPKFILENVAALVKRSFFPTILSSLRALGYNVEHHVLNTRDFGLPQHRERVYIVGSLSTLPILDFPVVPHQFTLAQLYKEEDRPVVYLTAFQQRNVDTIVQRMKKRGWDLSRPQLLDPQRSPNWTRIPPGDGVSPCLTTKAARFLWYCEDDQGEPLPHCRLSARDALSLQGLKNLNQAGKSRGQIIKLAGNAMSTTVLSLLFQQLV